MDRSSSFPSSAKTCTQARPGKACGCTSGRASRWCMSSTPTPIGWQPVAESPVPHRLVRRPQIDTLREHSRMSAGDLEQRRRRGGEQVGRVDAAIEVGMVDEGDPALQRDRLRSPGERAFGGGEGVTTDGRVRAECIHMYLPPRAAAGDLLAGYQPQLRWGGQRRVGRVGAEVVIGEREEVVAVRRVPGDHVGSRAVAVAPVGVRVQVPLEEVRRLEGGDEGGRRATTAPATAGSRWRSPS